MDDSPQPVSLSMCSDGYPSISPDRIELQDVSGVFESERLASLDESLLVSPILSEYVSMSNSDCLRRQEDHAEDDTGIETDPILVREDGLSSEGGVQRYSSVKSTRPAPNDEKISEDLPNHPSATKLLLLDTSACESLGLGSVESDSNNVDQESDDIRLKEVYGSDDEERTELIGENNDNGTRPSLNRFPKAIDCDSTHADETQPSPAERYDDLEVNEVQEYEKTANREREVVNNNIEQYESHLIENSRQDISACVTHEITFRMQSVEQNELEQTAGNDRELQEVSYFKENKRDRRGHENKAVTKTEDASSPCDVTSDVHRHPVERKRLTDATDEIFKDDSFRSHQSYLGITPAQLEVNSLTEDRSKRSIKSAGLLASSDSSRSTGVDDPCALCETKMARLSLIDLHSPPEKAKMESRKLNNESDGGREVIEKDLQRDKKLTLFSLEGDEDTVQVKSGESNTDARNIVREKHSECGATQNNLKNLEKGSKDGLNANSSKTPEVADSVHYMGRSGGCPQHVPVEEVVPENLVVSPISADGRSSFKSEDEDSGLDDFYFSSFPASNGSCSHDYDRTSASSSLPSPHEEQATSARGIPSDQLSKTSRTAVRSQIPNNVSPVTNMLPTNELFASGGCSDNNSRQARNRASRARKSTSFRRQSGIFPSTSMGHPSDSTNTREKKSGSERGNGLSLSPRETGMSFGDLRSARKKVDDTSSALLARVRGAAEKRKLHVSRSSRTSLLAKEESHQISLSQALYEDKNIRDSSPPRVSKMEEVKKRTKSVDTYIPFKARPLPITTGDFGGGGQIGVPKVEKRPLTVPVSPVLGTRRKGNRSSSKSRVDSMSRGRKSVSLPVRNRISAKPSMKLTPKPFPSHKKSALNKGTLKTVGTNSEQRGLKEKSQQEETSSKRKPFRSMGCSRTSVEPSSVQSPNLLGLELLDRFSPSQMRSQENKEPSDLCISKARRSPVGPPLLHTTIRAKERALFDVERIRKDEIRRRRKTLERERQIKKNQAELDEMRKNLR